MFSNGSYLKIWEEKRASDKYADVRATTSRKNTNGEYEQDFNGFVRLAGKAFTQYKSAGDKPSLKIARCGVTQTYDKDKKTNFTNFLVFEFEDGGNTTSNNGSSKPAQTASIPDSLDDEELPFT